MLENKVYKIKVGELDTNCYIMRDPDTRSAVIIDPGADATRIRHKLHELDTSVALILLTHGHFDHILAVDDLRTSRTVVAIHEADAHCLTERDMYSAMLEYDPRPLKPADFTFSKEGTYELMGFKFEVMNTPGHTDGSVCYIFGDIMFSGDTLFAGSIGRTDFIEGDPDKMKASLKRLNRMQGDYTVYPGHYRSTTLSDEKQRNPFLINC